MHNGLLKLKEAVCKAARDPAFVHHAWFVEHHLSVIEGIVEELLARHVDANATVCRAMVWVHDWGKILTNKGPNEEEVTCREIRETLPKLGFSETEVQMILKVYDEMEALKAHGEDFMIETKIISSADALSHYIGPFMALYWYENPKRDVAELVQANLAKVAKDERKLLLPEVRAAAWPRMAMIRESEVGERDFNLIIGRS